MCRQLDDGACVAQGQPGFLRRATAKATSASFPGHQPSGRSAAVASGVLRPLVLLSQAGSAENIKANCTCKEIRSRENQVLEIMNRQR